MSTNEPPSETPESVRPFWLPAGIRFDQLSNELQLAVVHVLNPAYRELVLEAPDALTRSAGITHVHLLWLEMVKQIEMGKEMENSLPGDLGTDFWVQTVPRHLRVVSMKLKVEKFLLQLHRFRQEQRANCVPRAEDVDQLLAFERRGRFSENDDSPENAKAAAQNK